MKDLAGDVGDRKVPGNVRRTVESLTTSLRPYQQQGVNWLQHLREHGLGGLLADDTRLGKTAQTIAHIASEEAADRMDRPAPVLVPTSLVPNWTHPGDVVVIRVGAGTLRASPSQWDS